MLAFVLSTYLTLFKNPKILTEKYKIRKIREIIVGIC